MDLEEIYALKYHKNHPLRRKFVAALVEQGKTEEEIATLLPGLIDDAITAGNVKSIDNDIRTLVKAKIEKA